MRLSRTLGHDSENTDDNSENIYEEGTWHNELDSHTISSNEEQGTVLPQQQEHHALRSN